jgi:hypothetical protein
MRVRRRLDAAFALLASALIASGGTCGASAGAMLSANVVPTAGEVQRFFPELRREARTGPDAAAVGAPKGSIAATYGSADEKKKLTVTAALYADVAAANAAYGSALARVQAAGAKPVALPRRIGQRSFAVTVERAGHDHVVVCALDGTVVAGTALVGYAADAHTIAKLASLTRTEDELAVAALE